MSSVGIFGAGIFSAGIFNNGVLGAPGGAGTPIAIKYNPGCQGCCGCECECYSYMSVVNDLDNAVYEFAIFDSGNKLTVTVVDKATFILKEFVDGAESILDSMSLPGGSSISESTIAACFCIECGHVDVRLRGSYSSGNCSWFEHGHIYGDVLDPARKGSDKDQQCKNIPCPECNIGTLPWPLKITVTGAKSSTPDPGEDMVCDDVNSLNSDFIIVPDNPSFSSKIFWCGVEADRVGGHCRPLSPDIDCLCKYEDPQYPHNDVPFMLYFRLSLITHNEDNVLVELKLAVGQEILSSVYVIIPAVCGRIDCQYDLDGLVFEPWTHSPTFLDLSDMSVLLTIP